MPRSLADRNSCCDGSRTICDRPIGSGDDDLRCRPRLSGNRYRHWIHWSRYEHTVQKAIAHFPAPDCPDAQLIQPRRLTVAVIRARAVRPIAETINVRIRRTNDIPTAAARGRLSIEKTMLYVFSATPTC